MGDPVSLQQNGYNRVGVIDGFTVIMRNRESKEKALDITYHVTSLTFFEDMFSPALHGEMVIFDAIDLLNGIHLPTGDDLSFPIVGEETISVQFGVTGVKTQVNLEFDIYSISDITPSPQNKYRSYILKFCSREHTMDAYTLVQHPFNTQISNAANVIFTKYLSTPISQTYQYQKKLPPKNLVTQATMGVQQLIIPRLSPFESMKFLTKRALAEKTNISGTYLFFESKKQFNFCDIEYCIQQGITKQAKDANTFHYYYGSAIQDNVVQFSKKQFKIITSLVQKSKFDTIEKLKEGVFESDLLLFDSVNQEAKTYHYSLSEEESKYVTLDKYLENSNYFVMKELPGKYTKKFFVAKDVTIPDTYIEKIIPERTSYMMRLAQNMFTIETVGDPTVDVGDVINIEYPTVYTDTSTTSGQAPLFKPDKYLSGNFLVVTIKHKLTLQTYYTTMDVYKIGYAAPVGNNPVSPSIVPSPNAK